MEQNEKIFAKKSKFRGSALGYFFVRFISNIIIILSFGLLYPFAICFKLKWVARKTIIDNKRLKFDGNPIALYGKFIIWFLLSVITFGIYYIFCMSIAIKKWQVKHTHIVGIENKESYFDGGALGLFGVRFLSRFVTVLTLGIGSFWAHCYLERWISKHTHYDCYQLKFNGLAVEYFGKKIVWVILTIITFGLYYFLLSLKSYKWTIKHTEMPDYPLEVSCLLKDGSVTILNEETNVKIEKNPDYELVDEKIKILEKNKKKINGELIATKSVYLNPSIFAILMMVLMYPVIYPILPIVTLINSNKKIDGKRVDNLVFKLSIIHLIVIPIFILGFIFMPAIKNISYRPRVIFSVITISLYLVSMVIISIVHAIRIRNKMYKEAYEDDDNAEKVMIINKIDDEIYDLLLTPECREI